MDDKAVTPVLGVLLLLPTIVGGAFAFHVAFTDWQNAQVDYIDAQTAYMEELAKCARDPDYQSPFCPDETPRKEEPESEGPMVT